MGFYFDNTEGHQEWVVPDNVTSIVVAMAGGSWPYWDSLDTLAVTPGEILHIHVGGSQASGGYNGGGAGSLLRLFFHTGGGGATDVRRGGNSQADRVSLASGTGGFTAIRTTPSPYWHLSGNSYPPLNSYGDLWPYAYWVESGVYAPYGIGVNYPYTGGVYGPAPQGSGGAGADAVYMADAYGNEVWLGAGGGGAGLTPGYGIGGQVAWRIDDPLGLMPPLYSPMNNLWPNFSTFGARGDGFGTGDGSGGGGSDWPPPPRPDVADPGNPFIAVGLPGAIYIAWDVSVARHWNVGFVGSQLLE